MDIKPTAGNIHFDSASSVELQDDKKNNFPTTRLGASLTRVENARDVSTPVPLPDTQHRSLLSVSKIRMLS